MMSCLLVGGALGGTLPSASAAVVTSGESPSVATDVQPGREPVYAELVSAQRDEPLVSLNRSLREELGDGTTGPQLIETYTVQEGDSLWSIAENHETDLDTLFALNAGLDADLIQPGQLVRILRHFYGLTYTVQDGDTLDSIAAGHQVAVADILEANGIAGEEGLQSGLMLFLPGARPRQTRNVVASRGTDARRELRELPSEDLDTPRPPVAVAAPPLPPIAPTAPAPIAAPTATWMWPLEGGLHSSDFGPRWGGFHTGIDIAVPAGTPAVAARAGVVSMAGWDGGYGLCVIIDHGDGTSSRYAHASALLVAVGQSVEQGQAVIQVGSTGNSTGDHLHFEIMVDGDPQDPRNYLP
ncbi:MAG TPA: M23 family metallopeptidase [Symbiobacteriaceae bacterium]|nr:M23 family metallopeptidase [Symbiobacteriaceae bacterium]